jgi:hypothetical protein
VRLIENYRYGENSENGVLTVYRQLPCRTTTERGEKPERLPTKAEQEAADRKERLGELTAQKAVLKKRKEAVATFLDHCNYPRLYDLEKAVAACTKAGIDTPSHKKHALAMRKELLAEMRALGEQIKEIKAEAKAAKEAMA